MSLDLHAPSRPWRRAIAAAMVIGATIHSALYLDIDLREFFTFRVFASIWRLLVRMSPPDLDSQTLMIALTGVWETLAISIVGTVLGAVIGLILMPLTARSLLVEGPLADSAHSNWRSRLLARTIHHLARLTANVLRTVPYFVWALLFWFMVGLGPFPGALAIAVHTGGVFARLYSSALDQLDTRPLIALATTGARRPHILLFGMLPALRPALLSYTLYRWEVNIRESAVLGIIGPIGIGYSIKYGISTFNYHALGTYLAAMMILVLLVDALSAVLRRRLV